MINLNKNTNNIVILELTSVSSLLNPSYLFEFINDINTSNITLFTGTDLSNFKCRYNHFNIIETGTTFTNYTASTVHLMTGSYTYKIYESSASTLNISATTGNVISTGKVYVNGTDSDLAEVYR